jgi:S-DNA-T family DNA segregation ATPase FtsK/SpoIIIE
VPDLDDDVDEDRPSRLAYFFGALAHTGYRVRSTIGRLLRRRGSDDWPVDEEDWAPPRAMRREPTLSRADAEDDEAIDFDPEMDGDGDDAATRPARPAAKKPKTSSGRRRIEGVFQLPALELLATPKQGKHAKVTAETLEENARLLESVLDDFGIRGEIVNVRPGPVVTLYELEPAPGMRLPAASQSFPARTPSASSFRTSSGKPYSSASSLPRRTSSIPRRACRYASARTSAAAR